MHNEALKMLRKEKNFTQAEMAEMLEVSRQSYIAWETGKYRVPDDIEQRLAEAGMATRASQKSQTRTIKRTTHPQCWLAKPGWYWTLAHPFWFASSDCPLRHKVPNLVENYSRLPTVAEYEAHKPPSPESVFELMTSHGFARNEILAFMIARGYRQFGEAQPPASVAKNVAYNNALARWNAEHPDMPGWSRFEEHNPQYRESAKTREPTPEETAKAKEVQQALDRAFSFNSETKGT